MTDMNQEEAAAADGQDLLSVAMRLGVKRILDQATERVKIVEDQANQRIDEREAELQNLTNEVSRLTHELVRARADADGALRESNGQILHFIRDVAAYVDGLRHGAVCFENRVAKLEDFANVSLSPLERKIFRGPITCVHPRNEEIVEDYRCLDCGQLYKADLS